MGNENPTVIAAHLSDKELRSSIDSLVSYVGQQTKAMADSFDKSVDRMKQKLSELGNVNVNMGGSSEGGSTRRTKAVVSENKNVNALTASYNELLGALQMAQRERRKWMEKDISDVNVKAYNDAVARTVEYQKQLNELVASVWLSNVKQRQAIVDMKEYSRSIYETSDGLKKMREYYSQMEKQSAAEAATRKKAEEEEALRAKKEGTIKALKEEIALLKQEADYMKVGSTELSKQNELIAQKEKLLKRELSSYEQLKKEAQKLVNTKFGEINTMSTKTIDVASEKLRRLNELKGKVEARNNRSDFELQLNRIQKAIDATTKKIKELQEAPSKGQKNDLWNAFSAASTVPAHSLDEISSKLERMRSTLSEMRNSGLFDETKLNRAQNAVDRLEQGLKKTQDAAKKTSESGAFVDVQAIKSAEQSFFAFLQGYREQAARLKREISSMPTETLERQIAEHNRWQVKIDETREKIAKLKEAIAKTPNENAANAMRQRLGEEYRQLNELEKQQILGVQRVAQADQQALGQKKQQYNETIQLIRQLTTEQSVQSRGLDEQEKLMRKIRVQAEMIRERMKSDPHGDAWFAGKYIIHNPNRKNPMGQYYPSVEEQLLALHKESARNVQARVAAEQQEHTVVSSTTQAAQQRLDVEKQITQTQEKRANIKPPASDQEYSQERYLRFLRSKTNDAIYSYNMQTSSVNRLNDALKQLEAIYKTLNSYERNSIYGKEINSEIKDLERVIFSLKSQMSKPVGTLDAIIGSQTKTIDEINYKIRQLTAYKNTINLTKPNADYEIRKVNDEITRLQISLQKYATRTKVALEANSALMRSFNYIKNRLAFMFTVGATTQLVKQLYDIRSQYELLERSIGILYDSMQKGSQIFAELNAMAIKSPFTTMELGAAAKQLSAYNIAAKDVVDTTRRLADVAAAVGIPIERLTYALGQIKSYGYLNSRDARMFSNAGIPLIQNLADMYTKLEGRLVSIGDVYDRIKKKQVSFEDSLKVINEMTDEGGRFFNFQEKAADTLKVKLANLTLAYNNMMNEIGKENADVLGAPIVLLKKIYDNWRNIDNAIWAVVSTFGVLKLYQLATLQYQGQLVKRMGWEILLGNRLTNIFAGIGKAMRALAFNPMTWITAAIAALSFMLLRLNDIQRASDRLNKSITDNAKENIESISKFFREYKSQIDNVGSGSVSEQEKMWERIRDEIEKTTKNAREYVNILNQIRNVAERIAKASDILEQQTIIQEEVKRLAEHGVFNVGGGFASDTLAKELREYEEIANKLIRQFGSLENAFANLSVSKYATDWSTLVDYEREASGELDDFVKKLGEADLAKIMGSENQLANLRAYTEAIRDAFLSTEEGQKISTEGQALLNAHIDKWIAEQGLANGLIDEQRASIERNRTAWSLFFKLLDKDQRSALEYFIRTGKVGTDEFNKMWNAAIDQFHKSNNTAYRAIENTIRDLSKAELAYKVVYTPDVEQLRDFAKDFNERFLTPDESAKESLKKFNQETKRLTTKYGRFQIKGDEDAVEYEKRLGEEYQAQVKTLETLTEQRQKYTESEEENREETVKELDNQIKLAKTTVESLKEIEKYFHFDFSKFDKKSGNGKDELAEALRTELQLIRDIQSNYDKLRKSGVSATDAIAASTQGYEATIEHINSILPKYGIDKFNASNFAGKNVRELLDSLTRQRNDLLATGKAKLTSLKDMDVEIQKLSIDAKTYDMKKVTDGLNNELSKVKSQYEFAIEMDASPELSDVFRDMLGVDEDALSAIPRTAKDVVRILQGVADVEFKNANLDKTFNLTEMLNKEAFDAWVKEQGNDLDDNFIKALNSIREYANKVRLDETKKQVEEWDKLLEKYSEYEYKRKQINEQYEREMQTARAKNAGKDILNAITRESDQKIAQTDFEQFQTTPQWITATGNLADLTRDALGLLISEIEQYKQKAKNLTPKQIKEINRTLTALYKQQRKNNPFHAIADAIDEARNRSEDYNEAIDNQKKKIEELEVSLLTSEDDYGEIGSKIAKAYEELERLEDAKNSVGQFDASVVVGGINEMVSVAQQGVQAFTELAEAIGGNAMTNASKVINNVMDVMQQAGTGAAIGAQIGGGWGAAIGAIAGTAQGLAIKIAKKISGDSSIDKEIAKSTLAVKQLENAYRLLEDAVNDAYGEAELSAKRLVIANKELQLEELKRQLQLEKSRKKKNRDKSKIADLEGQIIDLELEIKNAINDLTNSLLGIQSVGDAMSSVMDSFIEALRNGEDAMAVFDESVDDMIANMVKRMFTTKILQPWFEGVWDTIQNDIDSRSEQAKKDLEFWTDFYNTEKDKKYKTTKDVANLLGGGKNKTYTKDEVLAIIEQRMQEAQDTILASSAPTMDDIRRYAELLRSGQPILAENMKAVEDYLRELGLINDKADSSLSALQQGIQSITEPTASAIEGYLNIMSQRMFEQNDFIRQIVDVIAKPDESLEDVKVASLSRLLYEMQQSTQIQRSIYNILNGVVAPNGLSLNVSMI